MHGGAAPQVRAAARGRLAEEKAARTLGRLVRSSPPPVLDPDAELSHVAGEMREWDRAAKQLVAELQESGRLVVGGEIHPLVRLSERAQERLQRVLVEMARLGFIERKVQLDEAVAAVVVAAIHETFAELGQDPAPYVAVLAPKLAALDTVTTTGTSIGPTPVSTAT